MGLGFRVEGYVFKYVGMCMYIYICIYKYIQIFVPKYLLPGYQRIAGAQKAASPKP